MSAQTYNEDNSENEKYKIKGVGAITLWVAPLRVHLRKKLFFGPYGAIGGYSRGCNGTWAAVAVANRRRGPPPCERPLDPPRSPGPSRDTLRPEAAHAFLMWSQALEVLCRSSSLSDEMA